MRQFLAIVCIIVTSSGISQGDSYVDSMTLVPAGSFIMGDGVVNCGVDEHEVTLTRAFFLGRHEVSNREYLEMLQWAYEEGFVTATPAEVRDNLDGGSALLVDLDNDICEIQFDGAGSFYLRQSPSSDAQAAYPAGYDPANHPVKEVSWCGMASFCDWLSLYEGLPRSYDHADWDCNGGDPYAAGSYRLPTDAEWEYAAQYNDDRIYPWGNEDPVCARANFYYEYDPCVGWTTPAGSYPAAPASLGLYDLGGNMWELSNDWWICSLGTDPVVDPTGPASGTARLSRGGGWASVYYDLCCALRGYIGPELCTPAHGFRIARTAGSSDAGGELPVPGNRLWPAHPNPFNPQTKIGFSLPAAADVSLAIFDLSGRLVRELVTGLPYPAGEHSATWDGGDASGRLMPAGVYLYRLKAGNYVETRKATLLK